jgi:hypothetical protein
MEKVTIEKKFNMNNEQKTPEQWFQQLKEPYRSEAIANIDKSRKWYVVSPENIQEAIVSSFEWLNTTQGHSYWEKLHDSIQAGETTYLETETELKPQDMISGEWYVVEVGTNKFLINFKAIINANVQFHRNAWNYSANGLCGAYYLLYTQQIKSIRKATREEVLEHFPDEFQEENKEIHYSIYESLFNLMKQEHDVDLLPSEMEEIINVCEKILEARKDENKEVESELKDGEFYLFLSKGTLIDVKNINTVLEYADNNSTIYKAIQIGVKVNEPKINPIK